MIERSKTWGQVEKHDYIADHNGEVWRVLVIGKVGVRITNRAGRTVSIARPPADRKVRTFEPSETEAITLLQGTLGAEIVEEIPTT
jgi:hypothetical protein